MITHVLVTLRTILTRPRCCAVSPAWTDALPTLQMQPVRLPSISPLFFSQWMTPLVTLSPKRCDPWHRLPFLLFNLTNSILLHPAQSRRLRSAYLEWPSHTFSSSLSTALCRPRSQLMAFIPFHKKGSNQKKCPIHYQHSIYWSAAFLCIEASRLLTLVDSVCSWLRWTPNLCSSSLPLVPAQGHYSSNSPFFVLHHWF